MAKRRRKFDPDRSPPYTDKVFLPYVTALGQLALAWNGLHQTLALLFLTVMDAKISNQYLAIWHALKTDRAQRDILLAATKSNYRGAVPLNMIEDIEWLCKKADSVEEARNNAIHTPLWAYERGPDDIIVMPVTGLGHQRAQKLFEKNLLSEFRWCRDAALVLTDYAADLRGPLSDYTLPWPGRPQLPNLGDGQAAKYRPLPALRTPPRSSRG